MSTFQKVNGRSFPIKKFDVWPAGNARRPAESLLMAFLTQSLHTLWCSREGMGEKSTFFISLLGQTLCVYEKASMNQLLSVEGTSTCSLAQRAHNSCHTMFFELRLTIEQRQHFVRYESLHKVTVCLHNSRTRPRLHTSYVAIVRFPQFFFRRRCAPSSISSSAHVWQNLPIDNCLLLAGVFSKLLSTPDVTMHANVFQCRGSK